MKKAYRILLLAVVGGLLAWFATPFFSKWFYSIKFGGFTQDYRMLHLFIFAFLPLGVLSSLLKLSYGKIKSSFIHLLLSFIVFLPMAYFAILLFKLLEYISMWVNAFTIMLGALIVESTHIINKDIFYERIVSCFVFLLGQFNWISALSLIMMAGYFIHKHFYSKTVSPSLKVILWGTLLGGFFNAQFFHELIVIKVLPFIPMFQSAYICGVLPIMLLWAWEARKEG